MASKTGRGILEEEEMAAIKEISRVEGVLQMIPAEVISRRAVECGSYARALFHWEQYYRQQQKLKADTNAAFLEKDELLDHLQMIYAQIDEPDCMEGISAHLKVLNPEQQIIEDRKAGRWTAAQTWYEIALAEKPNDLDTQINLLTCLKESGQYGKKSFIGYRTRADMSIRRYSQLRGWIPCFKVSFKQYTSFRSRSRMVHGQMGSARANSCYID